LSSKRTYAAVTLAALALAAGCQGASPAVSTPADAPAERHLEARNCEIFIDKIAASIGSHGSMTLSVYVKLLKDRLDGDVAEVGLRTRTTSTLHGGTPSVQDWHNETLASRSPVNDYWAYPYGIMVSSDFGSTSYEGVFYVKTVKGTYYWAKPADGGNFWLDEAAATRIYGIYPHGNYDSSPSSAIPTQERDDMRLYNPSRCY
jgi:hypothetical protein